MPAIDYANELTRPSPDLIAHWKVISSDRGLTLEGNCPVCQDECRVPVIDVVVSGTAPAAAGDEPVAELTRQIICNCRMEHRPPTGVGGGCGRYWLGTLTRQDDGSYLLAPEPDLGLLPAAGSLNDAIAAQDQRIQSSAEKWLGAVTAIYGLFSLIGIATAKDALAGLGTWSKLAVAVVLVASLALAATALTAGYRAAYGWPRAVAIKDNKSLAEWYDDHRGYATRAVRQLRTAITCAFASLGGLVGVMVLVWFLPRGGK
jgi:hypothetical protein